MVGERASEEERTAALSYTGPCDDGMNWGLIRLAQGSVG